MAQTSLVQALYSFKGKNNDELCFKRGDVITVTQKEDGGWWEGTLGGVTGWFPSNYVKDFKAQGLTLDVRSSVPKLPEDVSSQQKQYRNLVLKDLIDSERAHRVELQALMSNFLDPLYKSEKLPKDEYRQLVGNMSAVIDIHVRLLSALEAAAELSASEQRVGRLFISMAGQMKQVHLSYCSSHPRAVCILSKHKDELNTFMEAQGAASPGLLVLTTGLSKPFRRLEKYSGMLQELERHLEESHVDRGDTQRAISVYKEIWSVCSTTRRQKEQALEVLTNGVRGWEGEDLSTLGEILSMGSVAIGPDHRDRYLLLFPSTLLLLSVSSRMSGFIYEGKLPLSGITVSPLPDTDIAKNAFEISGPLIERIVAVCQTKEEQQSWVESLRSAIRSVKKTSMPAPTTPVPSTTSNVTGGSNAVLGSSSWTIGCLKPLPPLRTRALLNHARKAKSPLSPTKSVDNNFEEDIQILRVIEAYCGNSSFGSIINSGRGLNELNPNVTQIPSETTPPLRMPATVIGETFGFNPFRPRPLSPETNVQPSVQRQMINGVVNGVSRHSMASKEKYVMESIDLLRNQLTDLSGQLGVLSCRLDEEIRTRSILQNTIQIYFLENKDTNLP